MENSLIQSGGGSLFMLLLVALAAYTDVAYCIQTIANKTGTDNPWWAWVPILNLWLLCEIGGKPGWWVFLMFIPIINLVIFVLIWMAVSDARQKSPFLGFLILVPFWTLILPGYLAFTE
jgi:hypothetical protein